jgi:hypothetical protein
VEGVAEANANLATERVRVALDLSATDGGIRYRVLGVGYFTKNGGIGYGGE